MRHTISAVLTPGALGLCRRFSRPHAISRSRVTTTHSHGGAHGAISPPPAAAAS